LAVRRNTFAWGRIPGGGLRGNRFARLSAPGGTPLCGGGGAGRPAGSFRGACGGRPGARRFFFCFGRGGESCRRGGRPEKQAKKREQGGARGKPTHRPFAGRTRGRGWVVRTDRKSSCYERGPGANVVGLKMGGQRVARAGGRPGKNQGAGGGGACGRSSGPGEGVGSGFLKKNVGGHRGVGQPVPHHRRLGPRAGRGGGRGPHGRGTAGGGTTLVPLFEEGGRLAFLRAFFQGAPRLVQASSTSVSH